MQKQEEISSKNSKNNKNAKNNYFGALHEKLTGKSRDEALSRGKIILKIIAAFTLGIILSGKELPYGVYPLGIPLICGIGKYYSAAALGAVVGAWTMGVGKEYIFAYIAVFLIRLLMSLPYITRLPERITRLRPEGYEDKPTGELSGKAGGFVHKVKNIVFKVFSMEGGSVRSELRKGLAESIVFKVIISATGGFIAGLFLLLGSEFSYYSLASLVFMMLICSILTLMLSGLFEDRIPRGGFISTVSVATLMILSTYASSYVIVFDLSLAPLLALFFTLVAAKTRGIASALVMGFFTGLCFDIRYAPMIMISAIAYILLRGIKLSVALATVSGICLIWCYYFSDVSSFIKVLPPTLMAVPLFWMLDKLSRAEDTGKEKIIFENKYFAKSVSEESKNMAVRARVSSLSDAFSSLSDAVGSLSDKFRRPDALGLREITDRGFSTVCEGCPNRDVCFGAEYNRTVEVSGKLTSALHKKGFVDEGDLGEEFSLICVRKRKLINEMNRLCAESTERLIKGQKMGIFASNYDDIKDILQDAIEADSEEYECDTEAANKIYELFKDMGYIAEGVVVCGKRCRRVMIKGVSITPDAHGDTAAQLCAGVSEIVGVKMVGPVFEVGDDGMLMLFSAKPKLRAICSSGRLAAFEMGGEVMREITPFDDTVRDRREECCGDVTNSFLTDTSYFYSLISDGMGSGPEAAFSAGISSMFCEKMLMAGNRADITIRMLNNFLRGENSQRGSESSVTVDILELDLMLGVASFIKSGAAPTYVLRRGEVYKIAAKTMPVGIIKNPDIKITRFDMQSGDLVLMMSDGITGDGDECEWIAELLCDVRTPESATAAICEGEKFAAALRDKVFSVAQERMARANKFDDVSLSVVFVI